MLFRTKNGNGVIIDRTHFNNDHDYYSYIRTCVIGCNNTSSAQCLIDKLASIVKKK